MNLTQAQDNYEANASQADYDLAQSIKLNGCKHKNTYTADDDNIHVIFCKDCPKQWSESGEELQK